MKCNRFGELANIFVCFKLNFAWAKQISASKRKHPVKRSAHKTVNSHNRLNRCVCSCILSCYVIMWNRTHLQIGIYRVDETQRETEKI